MAQDFKMDEVFNALDVSEASQLAKEYEGCTFRNCSFSNVNLADRKFSECRFEHCDLSGAVFENTLLEAADLRAATNYRIDPELNRISGAKFSLSGLRGLLGKYHIIVE